MRDKRQGKEWRINETMQRISRAVEITLQEIQDRSTRL